MHNIRNFINVIFLNQKNVTKKCHNIRFSINDIFLAQKNASKKLFQKK